MLEGFFRSPRSIVRRTAPQSAGGTSSGFDSPAALLNGLFEHPAGMFFYCAARLIPSKAHVQTIEALARQISASC
ncbi:hypothetical protein AYO43_01635 [Nitrospira sp. SCGC AG-212-E16]|nr:hypothetical protein AYO43_01635 [Nitrospira sp. SCGC AG-212-E16]